jgi:hypothetical protein
VGELPLVGIRLAPEIGDSAELLLALLRQVVLVFCGRHKVLRRVSIRCRVF